MYRASSLRWIVSLATLFVFAPAVVGAETLDRSSPRPQPSTVARPSQQAGPSNAHTSGSTGTLRIALPGEWQVRLATLSDIPLATAPGTTGPSTLGQHWYLEQWFRFRPEVSVGDRIRIVSQIDVARGIPFGESTRQVELSRDARNTLLSPFPYGPFDLRWLYLEGSTPIGIVRIGQQGSHWGLGIVANDGNHPPVFGDYRLGDIVERIALATRPFGRNTDLVLAIAGDLVYRDRITRLLEFQVPIDRGGDTANVPRRTLGGDRALQFVFSTFYQHHDCRTDCERKRVGVYAVYRDQVNRVGLDFTRNGDFLRVWVVDLFARWEWPTPDGRARVFASAELAGIVGTTTLTRNVVFQQQNVVQFGGAFQLGVERDAHFRIVFEGGYASGDSNPVDDTQRRFTFNPDHRVGLILFPELLAWQTARSASISVDDRLLGRPTPGAELFPSSGGVTNAAYIYPTAVVNLTRHLDVRAGMVAAVSTSDWVDPTQVFLYGNARNYRGGDAKARDLGVELDAAMMGTLPLGAGITLTGGVQGGVLFPGRAFDTNDPDPSRRSLGPLGLAVARAGLLF